MAVLHHHILKGMLAGLAAILTVIMKVDLVDPVSGPGARSPAIWRSS